MQYRHIDPAVLMDAAGDDQDSFGQLLAMFVGIVPDLLRQLEEAVREGRPGDVSRHAHSLKSSVLLVGASACAGRLEQLERRARLGAPILDSGFGELHEELLDVIAEALACHAATARLTEQ